MELTDKIKYRFRGPRALYGINNLQKLLNSHVCVAGAGGVGSWAIEAMVRTGIGHITIIDCDTIDESNTNRQLHTLQSTLGQPKAEVLKSRLLDINPDAVIDTLVTKLNIDNIEEIMHKINADFYVDAIDDLDAKATFVNWAIKNHRQIIVSGGAGGKTDPLKVTSGDLAETQNDKLLARLRYKLRKEYNYPHNGKKMRIPTVYSTEQGKLSKQVSQETDLPAFGAAVCVTATVGLNLAAFILNRIKD